MKWATTACSLPETASPCSSPVAIVSCSIAPSVAVTDCYKAATACSPFLAFVVGATLTVGRENLVTRNWS